VDWANESYVRLYTRDTTDWLSLSFEAKALFCLLLRKVDRAGVLPLGKAGPRGAIVAIGHSDLWPKLEPALNELAADGCVTMSLTHLVIPNFLQAQETQMSDKERKRKSRELRRNQALHTHERETNENQKTNKNDGGVSHAVTPSHTESHAVTLYSSVLDSSLLCSKETPKAPLPQPTAEVPPAQPASVPERKAKAPRAKADATEDELRLFVHWQSKCDHPNSKLDAKRLGKIRGALKSHGMDACFRAIEGVASSAWHRENAQDDIELILRDASHIEKYSRLIDRPATQLPLARPIPTKGILPPAPASSYAHIPPGGSTISNPLRPKAAAS
jgi:hypothetical protein